MEKRLKLNKEVAKQFRIARATTGLSLKDVYSSDKGIDKNIVRFIENPDKTTQRSIALEVAERIISFYEKNGYKGTGDMAQAILSSSYLESNPNRFSKVLKRKLKAEKEAEQRENMRRAASEILSKVSLTPHNSGELTVPTADRFLREKVASLSTDVSHIKKMINLIAKELGLEK